ncbi:AlbA family DNA-binding domain-containing protein [Streptomyces sp. SD31]|uniref:AlbA family DNA-binding domain-containing protein n=1 Tax=Streptomyces sp. SD31 TaxID=3452208 RepID=UPI003F8B9083
MTLNVSTDRPLRSPRQLLDLVTAIRDAAEHDESDWIEWKSNLDLTKKEVKATLARHIIGMANRIPEKSAATCGGYGYIAIGVEPENVEGVTSLDLADLDSGLQAYLGHQGPEWSASYVTLDGRTVLVISVEPAKIGDPIHTLHKDFANYTAGMIFVRRMGRTVQANPGEVVALTRRATQSTTTQQKMSISSDIEPVAVPLWKFNEFIGEAVAKRRAILLDPKNSTRRPNRLGIAANLDSRTEADYMEEVAEYIEEYHEHLINSARKDYVRAGAGAALLTVSNPDQMSHQGVRVELNFPTWLSVILAKDYEEVEFKQPRPPEPLGTKMSYMFNTSNLATLISPRPGQSEIETSIEPGIVVFNVASVRAEGHVKLPKIHFIAESWTAYEGVVDWAVTALNSGGRARGSIQLTQAGVATYVVEETDPKKSES